jgi:tetratricopeptide (TPR) repeat protein
MVVKLLDKLARYQSGLGNPRQAAEYHEQSLEIYEKAKDTIRICEISTDLSHAYLKTKNATNSIDHFLKALELSKANELKEGETENLHNAGVACAMAGDFERASKYYNRSLSLDRELKRPVGEANNLWKTSLVMEKTGDMRNAIKNAESVMKIYKKFNHPNTRVIAGQLQTWKGSVARTK